MYAGLTWMSIGLTCISTGTTTIYVFSCLSRHRYNLYLRRYNLYRDMCNHDLGQVQPLSSILRVYLGASSTKNQVGATWMSGGST